LGAPGCRYDLLAGLLDREWLRESALPADESAGFVTPPRRARPESANTPRCKRLRVWWGGGHVGFRGQLPAMSLPRYPKKKIPQPPQSVSGVWGCLSARQGARRRARFQPHPSAARTLVETTERSSYRDAVSVAPRRQQTIRLANRVKPLGGRKGDPMPRRPPETPKGQTGSTRPCRLQTPRMNPDGDVTCAPS